MREPVELDLVSPRLVRSWLAGQGWSLQEQRSEVAEVWTLPKPIGRRHIGSVLVPLLSSYADFDRRWAELLMDLREAYALPERELLNSFVSAASDLFFVRLDQYSVDGTIPFINRQPRRPRLRKCCAPPPPQRLSLRTLTSVAGRYRWQSSSTMTFGSVTRNGVVS
jgi:hypothetical protein